MISWTDTYTKAQIISGDTNATTLIQLKQDLNLGYKKFNAAINRYFTRKQQFADIVAGQQYYQVPIDSIRVSTVTVLLPNGLTYPVKEMRSEWEWRETNIIPVTANYATWYFVLGNDQVGLWPIPASTVTQGLRFVYQPQDVDLSKEDYSTGSVTITNGDVAVVGTGTSWNQTHVGMSLSVTDGTDGNWYEVLSVTDATHLTLKTPYAGASVTATTYKLGQLFITPGEYNDVPVDFALYRFFEKNNNPQRAAYHKKNYDDAVEDAVRRYASSNTSQVITDDKMGLNMWYMPPMPGA